MIQNRSVPADLVLPHLVYDDVAEAVEWLAGAFGFVEHFRYGNPPAGAQLRLGNAWIMIHTPRRNGIPPARSGHYSQCLTVFVPDVDAHYDCAKAAGARIIEEPHVTEYGERQYGAMDFAGHHWLFALHARDVGPEEWGATVAAHASPSPKVSPMLAVNDAAAAVEFYAAAFGATTLWKLGDANHMVAGLAIEGAPFFLSTESPEFGTRGPAGAGFTTVRIELFVDDPVAAQQRALAAGAREHSPVREHLHETAGAHPIRRMLQGAVLDPFGHLWLIGKVVE